MIIATNLGEKYNNKMVLEDLYFTIQTSKVTVFLVPNGAGKSTIMRLILGLDSGDGLTVFDDLRSPNPEPGRRHNRFSDHATFSKEFSRRLVQMQRQVFTV